MARATLGNAVLHSYHPQSISHFPGGVAGQERERLSVHHNVYAYSTERVPNIRGNNLDVNVEQNVMHRWASAGLGSSYALQLRCRGGGCPQRVNLIENHFTSMTPQAQNALLFSDSADPAEVFSAGNRFPAEESDDGTAPSEYARAAHAEVTLVPDADLIDDVLPFVGLPVRTAEEAAIFEELATTILAELP